LVQGNFDNMSQMHLSWVRNWPTARLFVISHDCDGGHELEVFRGKTQECSAAGILTRISSQYASINQPLV